MLLPNGTQAKMFTRYPVLLFRDMETSDDMDYAFEEEEIDFTGVYEKSDRGAYELITIKKGAKATMEIKSNGSIYLYSRMTNDNLVFYCNANLGIDFEWDVAEFNK